MNRKINIFEIEEMIFMFLPFDNSTKLSPGFINLNDVAARLTNLRGGFNLTREHVCQILFNEYSIKLSAPGLWKYETGNVRNLNMNTISALSKIYNVRPKFILYGDTSEDVDVSGDIARIKLEIIKLLMNINDLSSLEKIYGNVKLEIPFSGTDENNY